MTRVHYFILLHIPVLQSGQTPSLFYFYLEKNLTGFTN
jgi:hypothetical protein